jgi:hypothetical protein
MQAHSVLKNALQIIGCDFKCTLDTFSTSPPHNEWPEFVAISAQSSTINKEARGFGVGKSRDESAFLATMELLERLLFFKVSKENHPNYKNVATQQTFTLRELEVDNNLPLPLWVRSTSNGYSVHSEAAKGLAKALAEVIERHIILKGLALNIPPQIIENNYTNMRAAQAQSKGWELKFYLFHGPLNYYVTISRLRAEGHCLYGFGSSIELNSALEYSFSEIVPKSHLLIMNKRYTQNLFFANEHLSSHWKQSMDWTQCYFEEADAQTHPIHIDSHLENDHFYYHQWVGTDLNIGDNSFVLSRVISPHTQPLFHGQWDKAQLNYKAITNTNHLPPDLHFIG